MTDCNSLLLITFIISTSYNENPEEYLESWRELPLTNKKKIHADEQGGRSREGAAVIAMVPKLLMLPSSWSIGKTGHDMGKHLDNTKFLPLKSTDGPYQGFSGCSIQVSRGSCW